MIRCLIVEDEPLATEILQDYISQVPFLKLAGTCSTAMEALQQLQSQPIDLVFLDIHLPGLKGNDFLKSLKNPPAVIFTTAYHEYALQGYELNVRDYLLKPIEFSRFLEAVNKVVTQPSLSVTTPSVISIQRDRKTILIPVDSILYIESQKEYIKIVCTDAEHVCKYGLSAIESELDAQKFLRIHRSFIISLSKVTAYGLHEVDVAGKTIPIGGNYSESASARLRQYFGTT